MATGRIVTGDMAGDRLGRRINRECQGIDRECQGIDHVSGLNAGGIVALTVSLTLNLSITVTLALAPTLTLTLTGTLTLKPTQSHCGRKPG